LPADYAALFFDQSDYFLYFAMDLANAAR